MPNLVVLVPALNAEQYIEASIQSTLEALPRDAELHVINDGSTDRTAEVLSAVRDKRLKIHSNKESLGVSKSLNALLDKTDSKFVSRMDADDICHPQRFEYQLKQFEKFKTLDFTFSRVTFISSENKTLGSEKSLGLSTKEARYSLILGNVFSHPTMTGRREALISLKGYKNTAAEDYDLWLRGITAGKVFNKSWKPLVKYRIHNQQLTSNSVWKNTMADDQLVHSFIEYIETVFETKSDSTLISGENKVLLKSFFDKSSIDKMLMKSMTQGPGLAFTLCSRLLMEKMSRLSN